MRKIMIFQHVAHELLGTLNPLLKDAGFRIRYVNFERHPEAGPSIEGYNGLVVLGGPMGVYEADRLPHLKYEMRAIEAALKKDVPVLGICLGSQLLAHVLGAQVGKHVEPEIGWYDVRLTEAGQQDRLFQHWRASEKIFQMHGDAFEVPRSADHLAWSDLCEGQAFRYGEKVYGLQFHLEVDGAMVHRWLKAPANRKQLEEAGASFDPAQIERATSVNIAHSLELSRRTFSEFIRLFGLKERPVLLDSGHGKPRKAGE